MQDVFIEAIIADIHFGSFDPRTQYKILEEQFLSYISRLQVLDAVTIAGDIFDHKFIASSDAILYSTLFIENLINICRQKQSTLIIVGGTASHDADQLKLFYHYIGTCDIRIVEEVKFEYVKNKKILIIPELYNKGAEYYAPFLYHELYDACYAHSTYKGAIFGKDVPSLDSDREPVFCMDYFVGCKGPIISGHVHKPQCFDSHFYYCGSPYRWQFGEEEDKGFIILAHNIMTRQYIVHYEPITSFRYDTINLDDMIGKDAQQIINYIKAKKDEGIDNIRVRFTKNDEVNLPIVKSYFRNYPGVKIDANFKNEELVREQETLNTQYKEYDFIFDKAASPYEILAKYINYKEGDTFITSDALIELLRTDS